jgi:excisionase family DNA binding protein
MATAHPGVTGRRISDTDRPIEPLAVSPREACLLLGIGNTRLYELIRERELVTYHEGRARRITMESIHARVARLAGANEGGEAPHPRRRGRLPKHPGAAAQPRSAHTRALPLQRGRGGPRKNRDSELVP